MSYSQKENAIRESRTILATKNNLMGISGKFGLIVKTMGHPIMRQGSSYYDVNYLEDEFDYTDTTYEKTLSGQNGPQVWRDEILDGDADGGAGPIDDDNSNFLGYVFDGLSRGLHFEIQYTRHEHSITVHYKGFQVYKEVAGELVAYAPFPEWEDITAKLYKTAKTKYAEIKGIEYEEFSMDFERKKQSFWQSLRLRWGI